MKNFEDCEVCQKRALALLIGFATIGVWACVKKTLEIVKKIKNNY